MKPLLKYILPIALLASPLAADAAVVYEQPHTGTGAILQSSRYQPNGTDHNQFVRDSFALTNAQARREIRRPGGHEPGKSSWGGDIIHP